MRLGVHQTAQLTHGAQLTRICRHFDKFGAQLQQNTLGFLQRRQIARRQQRLPRQRNRQIFTGMTRRARRGSQLTENGHALGQRLLGGGPVLLTHVCVGEADLD